MVKTDAIKRLAELALAVLLVNGACDAAELIIANKACGFDQIDRDSLKALFLGKKRFLPSGESAEIILRENGVTHEAFLRDMLDESPSQFTTYWKRILFTGQGRTPITVVSDQEVIDEVAKHTNAIGYIDAGTPHADVTVIAITN